MVMREKQRRTLFLNAVAQHFEGFGKRVNGQGSREYFFTFTHVSEDCLPFPNPVCSLAVTGERCRLGSRESVARCAMGMARRGAPAPSLPPSVRAIRA
eukprot:3430097-Prymnesium_polylepis.1